MKAQKVTVSRARAGYELANQQAARVILADSERYQGAMTEWARLVLRKAEPTITGPLFKAAA